MKQISAVIVAYEAWEGLCFLLFLFVVFDSIVVCLWTVSQMHSMLSQYGTSTDNMQLHDKLWEPVSLFII